MKNLNEIKEILYKQKSYFEKKYKVSELGIFGSYVKGEQNENSDLDILVEYSDKIGFFDLLHLEEELSALAGIKVDLVMKSNLKKYIGRRILKEVQYL